MGWKGCKVEAGQSEGVPPFGVRRQSGAATALSYFLSAIDYWLFAGVVAPFGRRTPCDRAAQSKAASTLRFAAALHRTAARWLAMGLLMLSAVFLNGCLSHALSRPPLTKQEFLFSTPSLATNQSESGEHVLQIRRLAVAAPFDNQSFLYRTGSYSYERDPYAEFLVPPEETLLAPLRGYFRDSGLFSDVVGPNNALRPEMLAEIYVSELYGDFRNRAAPMAVLRIEFTFSDVRQGSPGGGRLHKVYEQRMPLRARTAAALMAGWNEGLQRMVAEVTNDLKGQGGK